MWHRKTSRRDVPKPCSFVLTHHNRSLVLHVCTTAGSIRPEGEGNAVAVWDVHLAVGLEGDMTELWPARGEAWDGA